MKKLVSGLMLAGIVSLTMIALAQQGPKSGSSETVARPRNKKGDQQPQLADDPGATEKPRMEAPGATTKIPTKFGKKDKTELPQGLATFKTDTTTVSVDVSVLDNKGRFIPNIPRGNFRILEDGVPQPITTYAMGEAPMTVCMVIEFSNLFQQYWSYGWMETLQASYGFLETLKPEDYVAVVAYDLRAEILSDFSTDKRAAHDAMARLRIAAYSESNLYDALVETADRMQEIEGRKAIVVIASGIDTFSKLTFDKTRRALQTAGVPIYALGIMQYIRELADARGGMGAIQRLDFLQADNQMRTFAKETGGQSYFPRFQGELPGIFQAISQALRNQYALAYQPSNQLKDGKYRKIKVELVNPATNEPLRIVDEKSKPIKYTIMSKQGYNAPREVE